MDLTQAATHLGKNKSLVSVIDLQKLQDEQPQLFADKRTPFEKYDQLINQLHCENRITDEEEEIISDYISSTAIDEHDKAYKIAKDNLESEFKIENCREALVQIFALLVDKKKTIAKKDLRNKVILLANNLEATLALNILENKERK